MRSQKTKGRIAKILKERRKEAGLSVNDVLDALGREGASVSEKALYSWESGYRQPDADTFLILCEIYGIKSIAEITGNRPKAEPPPLSPEALRIAAAFDMADDKSRDIVRLTLQEFIPGAVKRDSRAV